MRSIVKRLATLGALSLLAGGATAPEGKLLSSIDLSKPMGARSPWRFIATQGPDAPDLLGEPGPGVVKLCLSRDRGLSCLPMLSDMLYVRSDPDSFSEVHFLRDARIVHPSRGPGLLLVQTASQYAANGDQRVGTQLLAYDPVKDGFRLIYSKRVGRNNNQEIRFVADGALQGAMVSAEPTDDKPFGYWITVSRPDGPLAQRYRQVLRYRSATHYGDGNPLAVIDSEMPNIQRQLGLWRPGMKLPLPARGCARPRLVETVLWCS